MADSSTMNSLEDALNAASASARYLVAVWRLEDGVVYLYRESENFPHDEFPTAQALLQRDLAAEANGNCQHESPLA